MLSSQMEKGHKLARRYVHPNISTGWWYCFDMVNRYRWKHSEPPPLTLKSSLNFGLMSAIFPTYRSSQSLSSCKYILITFHGFGRPHLLIYFNVGCETRQASPFMVKVKPKRFLVLLQTQRNVLVRESSSGNSIVLKMLQKLFSVRQRHSLFLQSKVEKAGKNPNESNVATEL